MIVTLLGFMGSGKTTIGKKLAKKLNYVFIDLDQVIEDYEEQSINDIFVEKGEDYFRQIESKILHITLHEEKNIVLSLGGGTPCFHANMDMIKNHSTSFYLDYPAKMLASRLDGGKAKRPLIKELSQAELVQFIETALNKRTAFYKKADHHISDFKSPVDTIIELLD
jgi:shikimate kinase